MDKKNTVRNHRNSVNYNALTTLSLVGDKCAYCKTTAPIFVRSLNKQLTFHEVITGFPVK